MESDMQKDTQVVTLRTPETVETEAADWLTRLDAGNLSQGERRDLKSWLAQDSTHAQALKEMAALWSDMDVLLNELPDGSARPDRAVINTVWHFPRVGYALSAFFLCVIGLSLWFVNQSAMEEAAFHVTTVGKQQVIHFNDGSIAHLNTDSMIESDFTENKRVVRLLRGEALFEVAHDKQRPFVVYAGDREVMAVGTKFVVRLNSENIVVTVTDGQVQLSKRPEGIRQQPPAEQEVILVSKGEEVEVNVDDREPPPMPREVEADELKRRLSWLDGQLVFKDEKLEQVIAEVSRYLPNRIIIDDPELREVRISGRFEIGDTDALLEAIEVSFNVKASHIEDESIHLSRSEKEIQKK